MIRRLCAVAFVAGSALLAGCAGPGGMSHADGEQKEQMLEALGTRPRAPHNFGLYGGDARQELIDLLRDQPVGWAKLGPSPSPELQAANGALRRLEETLARALAPCPIEPRTPGTGPAPDAARVALLAMRLEDLFEADRFSGHHGRGDPGWVLTPPSPEDPAPTSIEADQARKLLRAIRDALDMIQQTQ